MAENVAQVATPAVETVTGITAESTSSLRPVGQEAVNNLIDRVSKLRQETRGEHTGLVDVSGNPLASKNPDISPTPPEVVTPEKPPIPTPPSETKPSRDSPAQPDNEALQTVENMNKQKEIYDHPRFKEILGRIAAQETDGKTTLEEMQKKALGEFGQEMVGEIAQETQEQEGSALTAEQRTNLTKEVQNAFKENPSDMRNFTREASALTKAKAAEIKLQEDQTATLDQKTKATELVAELKDKYNIRLEKMVEKIVSSNPNRYQEKDEKGNLKEDPRNHSLIVLLREAPNNPETLVIMKKEAKKSLLKLILEWVLIFTVPSLEKVTEEAEKTATSSLDQQA